ncbi:MAG: hypothetical protein KC410_17710 [Anaerolineales bacterium]|nr:hypothetical protein [Anaerolineales bacterium]
MSNICGEYGIPRKLMMGFGVVGLVIALFLSLTAGSAQASLPMRGPNETLKLTPPTQTATATSTQIATATPTQTATATPTAILMATAVPTSTPVGYLFVPAIAVDSVNWNQVDKGQPLEGLLTIEACKDKPILGGTETGLHRWTGNEWEALAGINGPIYDILFSEDCSAVYVAILGDGVWMIEGQKNPERLGDADSVSTSRTLALRNGQLFVGTRSGVYMYVNSKWVPVGDFGEVTRLNQQVGNNRLYATIWQKEIRYNDSDSCTVLNCPWLTIQPPSGDNRLLHVISYKDGTNERLILGTSRGLYRRNNSTWAQAQNLTGTVFALAQTSDGKFVFSGIQVKGAWQTTDNGVTWTQIGSSLNSTTVVDFAIVDNTLYAATYDGGLWRIRFR